MKTTITWFATMLLVLSLTGCGDMMKAKSLAEPQIETFHRLLDAEKYSDIYSAADSSFKSATTEQKLTNLLSSVHRKLGLVKSSSTINWNISSMNMTTRIVMIQNTVFERGSATESFAFVISNSTASLQGYNINSEDLIEK
jgi:hypothetical protein